MLTLHTIYCRPADYPEHYVVRRCYVSAGSQLFFAHVACLYESLEDARRDLERLRMVCIPRGPDDDPAIVEVWV